MRWIAGGILALYAFLGVALVTYTRWAYLVDPIDDRFLLQFHWILVAAFLATLHGAARRRGAVANGARRAVIALALLALLVGQGRRLAYVREEIAESVAVIEAHEPFRELVTSLPEDTVVTSIVAPRLQERFGRPILMLWDVGPERLAAEVGPERDLVVLLHPNHDFRLDAWNPALAGTVPPGYRELGRHGPVVALAHDRDAP
jgi:hypothetical protein